MSGGGAARPPWAEFKDALLRVGFRPTKTRGQNFLLDENMIRSIIRDAGVERGDFVLEIGTGCGFLTAHLLGVGARLVTAEIEPRLAEVARGFLETYDGWEIVEGDVLASKHELSPAVVERLPDSGPWKLVANLPYGVSGPVLALVARLPNPPVAVTVLVQEELARRCAASPGEDAWGALAARLAPIFEARRGRIVRAELFWPRPRVSSALLHLELRDDRPTGEEMVAFDHLLNGLFRYRRKTLRSAYRRFARSEGIDPERPKTLGIDLESRVEALSVLDLLRLSGGGRADSKGEAPCFPGSPC